jgi:hypothetical protein
MKNPAKDRKEILTAIYNLKRGQYILVDAFSEAEKTCIRSGLSDPVRIAYRGAGAYKTKSVTGGLLVTRQ